MTQPPTEPLPTGQPSAAPRSTPRSPGTPPRGVRGSLLWRLAACVRHDHVPIRLGGPVLCACCGAWWPCRPRLLAARALARERSRPAPVRDPGGRPAQPAQDRDDPGPVR